MSPHDKTVFSQFLSSVCPSTYLDTKGLSKMKWLFALVTIALLSPALAACGGTGKKTNSALTQAQSPVAVAHAKPATTTSTSEPTRDWEKVDADKDNDINSAPQDDTNNYSLLHYIGRASPSDSRAITALITRYYKVATAGKGAKACSMLYSTLEEAVPEDYGQSPPGPPYMRGVTCPSIMTLFFKHFHKQLTVEWPKLKVTGVRLQHHHGFAVLSFGSLPERQILVAREGHTWKISALLDTELP